MYCTPHVKESARQNTVYFFPPIIQRAATKLDIAKFFLQIAWEIKALDNKKYLLLSEQLGEIGRMLGGWLRQLIQRNEPAKQ